VSASVSTSASYEFGDFRFDPGNARLSRGGVVLHAEPKALKVLEILLEHSGSLVDRDALFDRVWGRVVVTTGTLTRLIAELRRILGDDSVKPRYIETVHTKGYRWVAGGTSVIAPRRRAAPPERTIQLIGRNAELARLEEQAATSRLLTLAGPGGSGKTQLALEFARRCETRRPNSVAWIDLTAAADERALPGLVTAGLDVQIPPSLAFADGVAEAIGDRAVLLLLDNCEHVAMSLAPLIRTVLGRCPYASVVCTSQATLDLPEETVFWVAPLDLPTSAWQSSDNPVTTLLESGAVRLLRERACAVSPYFDLTPENARFVVDICCRLDGLPLALELAAARLTILTPQQLLNALDDRFSLLSRQSASEHARHGSLRHAIEWSYELLEERERDLLDCFGVFSGSWSLEAAQAVAGGNAKDGPTLNALQSLVQKSLVIVERSADGLRYRLLDSVRAFASARLGAIGKEEPMRLRHAQYFARLARSADAELLGPNQVIWMDHLDAEWSNLRATWEWLQSRPAHRALTVDLLMGLRWHFWIRGRYSEASQWYLEARELIEGCNAADQARLLNGYAMTMWHAARPEDAMQLSGRAAVCAARSGLLWEEAFALGLRGFSETTLGHYGEAERLALQAKELCARLNQPWISAFCSLASAYIPVYSTQTAQAVIALRAIAEGFDCAHDYHMRMFVAVQLALQEFLAGDLIAARRWDLKALEFTEHIGNPRAFTGVYETAAYIAAHEGRAELAARLMGAAEAGRIMSGAPQASYWVAPHAAAWEQICARVGAAAAQEFFTAGRRTVPREWSTVAAEYLSS
jgi:non-specific serine/threonine protein kinase